MIPTPSSAFRRPASDPTAADDGKPALTPAPSHPGQLTPAQPKRALITGGAGDLAQALRAEFARGGWEIEAPDRRQLDVTNGPGLRAWIQQGAACDLLVHNAGLRIDAPLARMAEADWDHVIAVHLTAAHRLARAAAERWQSEGRSGHLLFIGSHSGSHGVAGQANYAAAKAGLCGLAKSLATELGGAGIRVNVVLPGFLETRMTRDLDERARARHLERHVLGRFNEVADAARFIVFLDSMRHVSGQVFQLDSRVDSWT